MAKRKSKDTSITAMSIEALFKLRDTSDFFNNASKHKYLRIKPTILI